jgi:group I intron endonuclease
MNIYSIYKVTNEINLKVYIGFASDLTKRKYRHKHYAMMKKVNNNFYAAIRKYGWDNFNWEVIYQSKDRNHCLNAMEKFFIEEYRTFIGFIDCHGYNMTMGGDGSSGNHNPKTDEHKIKISQSCKGKKKTKEHILNAAYARSKEYVMIDPSGEIVYIKNMSEYCRIRGLNQSHMIGVCLGRYGFSSHRGYKKYE